MAVDAAVGAGALGARMMGGGFGGSVIALLPEDGAAVREAVCAAFRGQGWPDPGFLDAPPSLECPEAALMSVQEGREPR